MEEKICYIYLPPDGDAPLDLAPWPEDAERAGRAITLLKLTAELARRLLSNATPLNADALTIRAADADALAALIDPAAAGIDLLMAAAHAAGAQGIWQLAGVQPYIAYGAFGDGPDALALSTAERVIIVHLPHDANTPPGLTTLVPESGYCRVCGCSEENAGRCSWVEPTLCSRCAKEDDDER